MKHTVFFFMGILSAAVLWLCPAGCAGTPKTLPDYRNGPQITLIMNKRNLCRHLWRNRGPLLMVN
jgi:hypothetical protein